MTPAGLLLLSEKLGEFSAEYAQEGEAFVIDAVRWYVDEVYKREVGDLEDRVFGVPF